MPQQVMFICLADPERNREGAKTGESAKFEGTQRTQRSQSTQRERIGNGTQGANYTTSALCLSRPETCGKVGSSVVRDESPRAGVSSWILAFLIRRWTASRGAFSSLPMN